MVQEIIKDIGDFIFIEHEIEKADAIMIVGGSHPELGEKAAELWKNQRAPVILISGGVSIKTGKFPGPRSKTEIYNKQYETEYDFFVDVLLKNGVPESAFYGENKSSFTKENALFAREVVNNNQLEMNKAILICKSFHARRSLMSYQMAFPNTKFFVSPVLSYDITKDNWYKTDYGIQRVMGELSRCGNQFVEDFLINKALLGANEYEV
ncbi:YdcF family protein [Scatolibacter rhodanostii]|uniref:YdcF family protein n=1 Tax=Scatolibacter rhodanostii TaxID=2014781 RepID=UPI000C078841|nr:YdcF family protein [Scatolibacter rhodanostii]